jgi:hypothetical protein
MAALAATLAVLALPASAQAQARGGWNHGGGAAQGGGDGQHGGNGQHGSNGRHDGGRGGWQGNGNAGAAHGVRGGQPAARPAPQARVQAESRREAPRGNSGGDHQAWQQRGRSPVRTPAQAERRSWSGGDWRGDRRDAGHTAAVQVHRDSPRGRGDNARLRNDRAGADHWRGNSGVRVDRQAHAGNWNRGWRNDRRYDWRGYRSANRGIYNLGLYHSPYRGYSYRRLNPGFRLDALFFGSRYWIADPWQYRLPPAYGPYRWVRYYDDALLVDTYSGEVVDVIYDFFW